MSIDILRIRRRVRRRRIRIVRVRVRSRMGEIVDRTVHSHPRIGDFGITKSLKEKVKYVEVLTAKWFFETLSRSP
jgi:hypothetical protein